MPHPADDYTTSILLRALSEDDLALLKPDLIRVPMHREMRMVAPNTPVDQVFFPEGGICSIVSDMPSSGRTEIGIFGREGVSASFLLLGADRTPHESFVQVNGSTALRIDVEPYLAAVRRSETLRSTLLRYVQASFIQGARAPPPTRTTASRRGSRAGCSCATTASTATRSSSPTSSWR